MMTRRERTDRQMTYFRHTSAHIVVRTIMGGINNFVRMLLFSEQFVLYLSESL